MKKRKKTNPDKHTSRKCGAWRFYLVLGSTILVIIAGFLVLTITMTRGPRNEHESAALQSNENTNEQPIEETTIPPLPPLDEVLSPPETMQPIQDEDAVNNNPVTSQDFPKVTEAILSSGDPDSPPAKAYQWLLQDPNLSSLPDWRQLQRMALAILYYSTNGLGWRDGSGWLRYEGTECDWYPNACDNSGRIRLIQLPNSNLDGNLPTELFWLTKLQQIQLFDNPNLGGTIPTELGMLSELEVLWLHRCGFSATASTPALPSEIGQLGSSLLYLDVSGNTFRRSRSAIANDLPSEIGRLTQLREFFCHEANLRGTVPSEIGNLRHLEILDAHDNDLGGTLATEIGLLTQLQSLDLSSNSLEGTLSTEFGQMTALQRLWLFENLLTGPAIPSSWGQLSDSLTSLDLSMNRLDSLSDEVSELTALRGLWLFSNAIRGTIPPSLRNLSNLVQISLFGNLLTGRLPALSPGLRGLWLDSNRLTGSIPSEISASTNLISLHLFDNRLQGALPEFPARPSYSFEEIHLHQNLLTSTIPTSIGNLLNLEEFKIHRNAISGTIPSDLALLPLRELTLHRTDISGAIPWELCAAKVSSVEWMDIAINCDYVRCQCGCTCPA